MGSTSIIVGEVITSTLPADALSASTTLGGVPTLATAKALKSPRSQLLLVAE
jgi:hypothetical protein